MDKKEDLKHVKVVVCDIDNTLVEKHHDLSERGMHAYHSLKKKGVLFGLASGRGISQLHSLEERWNIKCDLLIGMNGSEMYDGLLDQCDVFYEMKAEWLKECFEIMKPFKSRPHLVRNGVFYARKDDETLVASNTYVKNVNRPHVVEDDSEFWAGDAAKVGFRVSAEDMPRIEAHVAKFPSENYIGFKTENTMFEFCNIHASKGKLLTAFCERHHIAIDDTCAFGDMTNDVSMLKAAGIGVCMLNGSEDAKKASDIITDKGVAEDGWADFVLKYMI